MADSGGVTQDWQQRDFLQLVGSVPVFSHISRAAGLQLLICWTSSHITELQNEGWFRVVCAVALVLAAFWLL